MAFVFELAAEFGQDNLAAESFSKYFSQQQIHLFDGKQYQCSSGISEWESAIWCIVTANNLPRSGIANAENNRFFSAAAKEFYKLLKGAPNYRYAIVGVETEYFRSFEELKADLDQYEFHGLVIAEDVLKELKQCKLFEPFASGYKWIPYRGESAMGKSN